MCVGCRAREQGKFQLTIDCCDNFYNRVCVFPFSQKKPVKCIKLQVKPHLLYKPNLNAISVSPDGLATFELFDRVVIARMGYSVGVTLIGCVQ